MSESLNNKELIAVGHEFAKAMSSDTAIIDIAKMMSRLAERLDCTTAALRETVKQRDASEQAERVWETTMMQACGEDGPKSVADKFASLEAKCAALTADNVARAEIIGQLVWQYSSSGIKPVQKSLNPASALLFDALEVLRQPATEAAIVELKAQGVDLFAKEMARTHAQCQAGGFFDRQVVFYEKFQSVATAYAQQLRAGEVQP
ncbi:hypothetical protein EV102420_23_00050 [Pseudescherichia vulneris NBRC 102420]|uniref:Uncharacterized protein n=1 Tax=Pseudescherichia vulneris NBRC 102420 TaxID=1115515 RepID=A0A090V4P5_PSEVU|nr:hypothetical protein [Pseudescherichia vulneris]GAL59781.1 hypothetical protein EV102420_23_00050 [Pseudescherichia vulneris NBRC 102420]STQ60150.1 Uncharacterised protein [Pseudescherichia vulneris]